MLDYSAPGYLGISQTRHPLIKFGTYKTRHLLNTAPIKLGTYIFKSMFKQYYVLNVMIHSIYWASTLKRMTVINFFHWILLKTYHTTNLCSDVISSQISTRFISINTNIKQYFGPKISLEYFSEALHSTLGNCEEETLSFIFLIIILPRI